MRTEIIYLRELKTLSEYHSCIPGSHHYPSHIQWDPVRIIPVNSSHSSPVFSAIANPLKRSGTCKSRCPFLFRAIAKWHAMTGSRTDRYAETRTALGFQRGQSGARVGSVGILFRVTRADVPGFPERFNKREITYGSPRSEPLSDTKPI